MNPLWVTWFETGFNVVYLILVWWMVVMMTRNMSRVSEKDWPTANLIRISFILLAAGDTGHVGFRVLATLMGETGARINLFGEPASLVGIGMLTTAYTVTLFYMVWVYIWRRRYQQPSGLAVNLLLAAGLFRLIFMALPGNDWGGLVPPQPMSLYRNIPLFVQGIGLLWLMFDWAYRKQDRVFQWIAWMVVASFAFYAPVIFFARQVPMLGMLMIPKTCAYLAIAWIAYRGLWQAKKAV
ncbi:MAG TPA: hypothetical protein PKW33_05140 [Anaerolineaceae bacterium]|nr:hypothetical protein [Anaerolineaceae bacterium]HPN50949.1 hypothetical protein [Anaerolineaceae bacterium]